jgi:hypothetical protein
MWFQFAIKIRHIHLHSFSEFIDWLSLQPSPVTVSWKFFSVMLQSVVLGFNVSIISVQVFP